MIDVSALASSAFRDNRRGCASGFLYSLMYICSSRDQYTPRAGWKERSKVLPDAYRFCRVILEEQRTSGQASDTASGLSHEAQERVIERRGAFFDGQWHLCFSLSLQDNCN